MFFYQNSLPEAMVISGSERTRTLSKKQKTKWLLLLVLNPLLAWASTNYTVLKSFDSSLDEYPYSALIEGHDGRLYGTTFGDNLTPSYGTIFAINKDGGGYVTLHSFTYSGGRWTQAALVQDTNEFLYGTTSYGGTADDGTVFKMYKDGSGFIRLHSFGTITYDGEFPFSQLLLATDGFLYGATDRGGLYDGGAIFKIARDGGSYMNIHSFQASFSDITVKPKELLEASDGFLYGVTSQGGLSCGVNGCGTVFKLSKDGSSFSVIHNFTGASNDGHDPEAGLIEGPDGTLYGTTFVGGQYGYGTVFALGKDGGGFQIVRAFDNDFIGGYVRCKLIFGTDGLLYGTAAMGSSGNVGVVFSQMPVGTTNYVGANHTFQVTDGANPEAGLIQGSDGAFYGTTTKGGTDNFGVVFRLDTTPFKFASIAWMVQPPIFSSKEIRDKVSWCRFQLI